jgi:hypothetical protein
MIQSEMEGKMDIRSIFTRLAEHKIEEAMQEGQFDNLPDKGKPIPLDDDWLIPMEWRPAMRLLKSAEVLPDWMQWTKELERAREDCVQCWQQTEREHARYSQTSVEMFQEWYEARLKVYQKAMRRVNDLILKYNVAAPNNARTELPFNVQTETERFVQHFKNKSDW